MDLHYQKYWNTFTQYTDNAYVEANCAAITFINSGTANVSVIGYLLSPGQGLALYGNDGELDVTQYNIVFSGAGTFICSVFRKGYVNG